MKTYRVVQAIFEDGEMFENVLDLVNVDDEEDRIMAAPDEFKVGDLLEENDFFVEECNYVDDQGTGVAPFAFKVHWTDEE